MPQTPRRRILTWLNREVPGHYLTPYLTPRTLAYYLSRKHTEFQRLYRLLIQYVISTGLCARYSIQAHEIRVLCIRTLEETLLGELELGEEELEDDSCEAWIEEILENCLSIICCNVREYQTYLFHSRTTGF